MGKLKRLFKQNTHNPFFNMLAGFGRSMNRLYENRNHDVMSNGELTVLKKVSKIKPSIIIDAGANVGNYALLANKVMSNARIYCFEPVEGTYLKLMEKVSGKSNIIPIKKGLYSVNCSKNINLFQSNTHSSLFDIEGVYNTSGQTQEIALIKGDDFLKKNNIATVDFLKIDVEGAEYETILGFEKYLEEGKIRAIQFEYGYINITTKRLLKDFYDYLENKGYVLGKIYPKSVHFRPYSFKHEDFIGPNFIAVKNTEKELIELLRKK